MRDLYRNQPTYDLYRETLIKSIQTTLSDGFLRGRIDDKVFNQCIPKRKDSSIMEEKRRDSKGRILNKGETQRKDGSYMYTYKDANGKKKCFYSWRLVPSDKHPDGKKRDASLREKEARVQQDLREGICSDDRLTVINLVDKYLSTKKRCKTQHEKRIFIIRRKSAQGRFLFSQSS